MNGAARVSPAAGLLEREQEVAQVLALLDEAVAGRGGVVVVEGPAGIGKTALLTAARADAHAKGLRILGARGAETERGLAFGVVRQLLERQVRTAPEARRDALMDGVAATARPLLLGTAPPAGGPSAMDGLLHGLYWVVAGLAEDGPLLIVVDDVQWADVASLRVLAHLGRRVGELPVAIAVAVRTGEPQPGGEVLAELSSEPEVAHVPLSPLSGEAVARLVRERLSAEPDAPFADACAELSGGNPFLLRELLEELVVTGVRPVAAEVARIADARPASVRRAVLLRLARMPPGCSAVAQALAVLERAPAAAVAELAGLPAGEADTAIDALVGADVLTAGDELAFRHPVLRTVVYEDLPPRERARRHADAARVLARLADDPEPAALHLRSTDVPLTEDDVALLRRAADRALGRGAPEQAAASLRRALGPGAPPPDFGRLLALGTAEQLAAQPAAVATLERAVAAAPGRREAAEALLRLAHAQIAARRLDEMQHSLDRAVEAARGADRELLLRTEGERAALLIFTRGQDALRDLDRYAGLAGGTPGERLVLAVLAVRNAVRGDPWAFAADAARRALAGGELLEDPKAEPIAAALVQARYLAEELDEGDALVARQRAAALRRGSAMGICMALATAGVGAMLRGDLRRAEEELEQAVALTSELRSPLILVTAAYLCQALVERGAPDRAQALLDEHSLDGALPPGPMWQYGILVARAKLRLAQGRPEDALTDAKVFGRAGARHGHIHLSRINAWQPTAVRALVALGDRDRVIDLAEEHLDLATARGLDRPIGVALHHLGLALDGEEGLDRLAEAVTVLRRPAAPFELAEALLALGSALRRARRPADARTPQHEAADLAERCGAGGVAARAVEELAATGVRRRRAVSDRDELTASERRIAAMAAEGMTNKQIAQALFVTLKTVESHLGSAYRKLGIRSRHELPAALAVAGRGPTAA